MDTADLQRLWSETIPGIGADPARPAHVTYRAPDEAERRGDGGAKTIAASARDPGAGGATLAGGATFAAGGTLAVDSAAVAAGGVTAGSATAGSVTFAGGATVGPGTVAGAGATAKMQPAFDARARYELIDELGRGGMGVVYRARQESLDREVAVKRILPDKATGPAKDRFVAEALVTGVLDHPNIVPVLDLGRTGDGEVFLAMKLVGGASWKDLLHPESEDDRRRAKEFDLVRNIGVLLAVCNAVGFAHSRGIVHRDLKPENVMVGDFGEVVVMDWGIAVDVRESPDSKRRAEHKSTIRLPSGTPCYMPPELAEGRGRDIGPWTDTYLLGAILYEVITGKAPHRGATLIEVLMAASESAPPALADDVPATLRDICRKALAKESGDRYRTVADLKAALEGYLRNRESEIIAQGAMRQLEGAEAAARGTESSTGTGRSRNRIYIDFSEAVAGFRQAQVLWAGNEMAIRGERRSRLAFAEAALAAGDFGLAAAQADRLAEGDPEAGGLRGRIGAAEEARALEKRRSRLARAGLVAAVVVIIAGLAVGFVVVKAEQKVAEENAVRAEKNAKIADENAKRAEDNAAEAQRNAVLASASAKQAQENAAREEVAKKEAVRRAEEARLERDHAQAAEAVATAAKEVADLERDMARQAEWRARLEVTRGLYDRSLALARDGRPQSAAACLLRALEVAPRDARPAAFPTSWDAPGWPQESWVRLAAVLPLCGRETARYDGHGGPVHRVAPSPDGALVATCGEEGLVLVFDAGSGAEKLRLEGHAGAACALAWSPDGKTLASGGEDKTIRLWNVSNGRERGRITKHTDAVRALAFSPDGALLASGGDDKTLRWYDAKSGAETGKSERHGGAVRDVAFTPDSKAIVTACEDGTARVTEVGQGVELARFRGHTGPVNAVAVSADGARALSASTDGTVRLFEIATAREQRRFEGPGVPVRAVALSPDGATALAGYADGTIGVRDMASGREATRLEGHGAGVRSLAFHASGRPYSAGADASARAWELPERGAGARLDPMSGGALAVAVAPDGRYVALGGAGGTARIQDLETGAIAQALPAHKGGVTCVAWSADGKLVATGGRDGVARIVEAATGRPVRAFPGHESGVAGIAFTPDGAGLATCDHDVARIFDIASGKELRTAFKGHTLYAIAVSADGKLALTGHYAPVAWLWSTETGVGVKRLEGHASQVNAVALSGDGRFALTGSNDGTARVWDVELGREVRRLEGHGGPVTAVAFGAGGRLALTGSDDRTARLWDVATGREIRRLDDHSDGVAGVAFAGGDRAAVTVSKDGGIRLFGLLAWAAGGAPAQPGPAGSEDILGALAPLYTRVGVRLITDGPKKGEPGPLDVVSSAIWDAGNDREDRQDLDGALADCKEALATTRAWLGMHPANPGARRHVSACLFRVGGVLRKRGEYSAAVKTLVEAEAAHQAVVDTTPAFGGEHLAFIGAIESARLMERGKELLDAGKEPQTPEEMAGVAGIHQTRRDYAPASALYVKALEASPKLRDHRILGINMAAATTSARAALEAKTPEDAARLRALAMVWLAHRMRQWHAWLAELEAAEKDLKGPAKLVSLSTRSWILFNVELVHTRDPDLESLRGTKEFEDLFNR